MLKISKLRIPILSRSEDRWEDTFWNIGSSTDNGQDFGPDAGIGLPHPRTTIILAFSGIPVSRPLALAKFPVHGTDTARGDMTLRCEPEEKVNRPLFKELNGYCGRPIHREESMPLHEAFHRRILPHGSSSYVPAMHYYVHDNLVCGPEPSRDDQSLFLCQGHIADGAAPGDSSKEAFFDEPEYPTRPRNIDYLTELVIPIPHLFCDESGLKSMDKPDACHCPMNACTPDFSDSASGSQPTDCECMDWEADNEIFGSINSKDPEDVDMMDCC